MNLRKVSKQFIFAMTVLVGFMGASLAVELNPDTKVKGYIKSFRDTLHDAIASAGDQARETLRKAQYSMEAAIDHADNVLQGSENKLVKDLNKYERKMLDDTAALVDNFQRDVATKAFSQAAVLAAGAEASLTDNNPLAKSIPHLVARTPTHVFVGQNTPQFTVSFKGVNMDQGLKEGYPKFSLNSCPGDVFAPQASTSSVSFSVPARCFLNNSAGFKQVDGTLILHKDKKFWKKAVDYPYQVSFQVLPAKLGTVSFLTSTTSKSLVNGKVYTADLTATSLNGNPRADTWCHTIQEVDPVAASQGFHFVPARLSLAGHELMCWDVGTRSGESDKRQEDFFTYYSGEGIHKTRQGTIDDSTPHLCISVKSSPGSNLDCEIHASYSIPSENLIDVITPSSQPVTIPVGWEKDVDSGAPLPPNSEFYKIEFTTFDGRTLNLFKAAQSDAYFNFTVTNGRFVIHPYQLWLAE